ncbi:MAG TPA: Calx-beta domain-containing protein, partial [Verrucomicrobiae bacterium]
MKKRIFKNGAGAFTATDFFFLLIIVVIATALALLARGPRSQSQPHSQSQPVPPTVARTATVLSVSNLPPKRLAPHTSTNSQVVVPHPVPAPAQPDNALAAFADFTRWAQLFTNHSANLVEGQRLAWKRREAMAGLIQSDPKRALELAAPFALRQSLPPQITRFLEQPVDGRGNFIVLVAESTADDNTVLREVELNGTNYQAFTYGRRLTQRSRANIPLHGIALDGNLALSAEPLRKISAAEAEFLSAQRRQPLSQVCAVSGQTVTGLAQAVYAESGGGVLAFAGTNYFDLVNHRWALAENGVAGAGSGVAGSYSWVDDAWTHGVKNVLYMRVNFPDDLTEPISEANAYAAMNTVNTFYTTGSYNQTALDPTVAPLVTLPQKKAYYAGSVDLLLKDAREATRQAGYDTTNYDLDILCFNSMPGKPYAGWSGLAGVGWKALWLQSSYGGASAGVTAHELGHNYGLFHANFWDAVSNGSMFGPGTNLEYGNIYDTMGSANAGIYQFNAVHKAALDWLTTDAVQVISSNGVYRIYPFDVPAQKRVSGHYYAAAVQKDSLRYYWMEFRQLFAGNPWNENGLLLNWSPWDESGGTQLIDTTPGSPNFGDALSREDAALVIGRTLNDQPAGVHITPLARGSSGVDPWIDVQVNIGFFRTNHSPVMKVEVDQTNVPSGALVHFHATATDPDGDTLAYAWSFDDLTFSTNNLPWTSKVFATSGDHVVRCVVSDMKGGQASANAVVTVGAPNGFRITGRVTDTNGLPLEGVLVSNGATDATGFIGGWTDSDGRYVIVNAADLTLSAVQFGHLFASTANWANPLAPTNDLSGIDFVGTPLPTVNVTVDTNTISESDTSAHYFTVTRTGDTNSDLRVNISLAGSAIFGTDYTLDTDLSATNSIVIPAGTNSVTFTLNARNDSLADGPETVTLTLVDDLINHDNPAYALAPPAEATITILDANTPATPVVGVYTPTPEISENGMDNGEFIFMRLGSTQNDLLVNYTVSGTAQAGADYLPLAGVMVIPAGQSSATVYLQPLDDHAVETNETVIVSLASGAYTLSPLNSATVEIQDDGANTVTVFPASQPAGEPSQPGAFTVKRDGD